MKDLWIVASYTIKDMLKKRTFIISNLIILIIIIVGFNVPNILNLFTNSESSGESSSSRTLIVDEANIFEGSLESLNSMDLGVTYEISNENISTNDIKSRIIDGEIDDAIVINETDGKINIQYIVENMAMMNNTVPETIVNTLTGIYTNLQISKLGLTEEELASLNPNFEFELQQAEEQEVKGNILVIMILSLVLFYAIYFCAYQVSSSITTEKTSKIIETLVTSTSPRTIVLGKTIGIGIVGLLQVIVIVAVALICAYVCLPEGVLESVLDLSQITPTLGILTIIYFILGYATYALLYALTGSTVSKPEDVQSANGPVAIIAVIGFYLAYFTMMNPTSDLNVFASIFPFSSPFCMPFRVMMGIASIQDVLISLGILVVTIIVIAHISIKIYSQAILNTGSRTSLKEMLNMYKNKNV